MTAGVEVLFRPIDLGGLRVKNRLMMTTHGPRLSRERYQRYLAERTYGDSVGLVGVSAGAGVHNFPFGPGRFVLGYQYDQDVVPMHPLTREGLAYYQQAVGPLRALADTVHENGAKIVGQVLNTGASTHSETFQPLPAPSVVQDEHRHHVPHALTMDEIGQLVEAFGHAGRRVMEGGLDGVEIHGAHGYLVHQFLSPITNRRTDAYGGSIEKRMRFLVEVFAAIRRLTAPEYPIGVRINAPETAPGGTTIEDVCAVARKLNELGAAYVNVSGGTYTGLRQGLQLPYVAPSYQPEGPNVPAAAIVREFSPSAPVIVAGRILDIDMAANIVRSGKADMVGFTRALIADPSFVRKAAAGKGEEVNRCIGCNECHYGALRPTVCSVNAWAGHEAELTHTPASPPKRVLIVGGGPAGMECARVAALRGHHVTLVEARNEIGGMLALAGRDPNRPELGGYIRYLENRLREAAVQIELGRTIEAAAIQATDADVVVLATGASDYVPDIPGSHDQRVLTAGQVLTQIVPPPPQRERLGASSHPLALGRRVAVVGGLEDHFPPLTMADMLASQGHEVVLLTELVHIGDGIEAAGLYTITSRLLEKRVDIQPMTALVAIEPDGTLKVANALTRDERTIGPVDNVVLACGGRPRDELAGQLAGKDVRLIGDVLSPRRLVHATLDGARLGSTI
ncbi:MAG: FAD-dependent oxidoreductase [Chloroflexi bacterium]|nr:FAD-dependent oxidoreductase [Chloroflexota bacterium]